MSSTFQTAYGITLYPIDYLMNEDLSESDLTNLFDKKSLTYSFIIEMFKENNVKKKNEDIIELITSDNNWMNKYKWAKRKFINFENKLISAYQNIYNYKYNTAKQKAEWFMTIYGFKVK